MVDWGEIVPLVFTGGVGTWAGNAAIQFIKSRGERREKQSANDVQVEQHRDKLMLDLLEAAQSQAAAARLDAAAARDEATRLRPLQIQLAQVEARLAHHEEALEHLRAVLSAPGPEERRTAERLANAFLVRTKRLADARGTLANEAQIARSSAAVPDDMRGLLDKLD